LGTGLSGVKITGASRVTIRKCAIRNFTQYGVDLEANANAKVFILDSLIIYNSQGGLLVQGAGGVTNFGIIDKSLFDSNGPAAITVANASSIWLSGSMLTGST